MRVRNSPFAHQGNSGADGLSGAPAPPRTVAPPLAQQVDVDDSFFEQAEQATSTVVQPARPGIGGMQPPQPRPGLGVQPPPLGTQPLGQGAGPIGHPFGQPQVSNAMPPTQTMPPSMQQNPMQSGNHAGMPLGPTAASALGATMGALASNAGVDAAIASSIGQLAAGQAVNSFVQSGMTSWFPMLFQSLQMMFNVGHKYVLRKLLLLLCPFVKFRQGAPQPRVHSWQDASHQDPTQTATGSIGEDGLKVNIEEPDLYIPLMSGLTYILVYGVQRGIMSDFRPELLYSTFSFAMVLLFLEVGLAKFAFFVTSGDLPFLVLLANCGYKYVPIALMVCTRIILGSSSIYYIFFLYFAASAAWALRRFMLFFEPSQLKEQYGVQPSRLHGHIILGLAIAQVPLCWLLTPSMSAGKV